MLKNIYITAFLLLCNLPLKGQNVSVDPGDLFEKANAAYADKRFSEAQILYQQMVDAGYSSTDLYYNLANTYYKMKKYGFAVFYYEKAKQLDPSDEDILYNLELTQWYLKDKIVTPPDFFIYDISKKILNMFSLKTWAVLSLIGWYIFAAVMLIKKIIAHDRKLFRLLFMLFVLWIIFCFINFGAAIYTQANLREAVVLNPSADVKSEPDPSGNILFVLHEGTKVQIRTDRNDWFEIRLKDGKVGWVRKDDLGTL